MQRFVVDILANTLQRIQYVSNFYVLIISLDYDDVTNDQHFVNSNVYDDMICSKVYKSNVVTQLKKCAYSSLGYYPSDFCI